MKQRYTRNQHIAHMSEGPCSQLGADAMRSLKIFDTVEFCE